MCFLVFNDHDIGIINIFPFVIQHCIKNFRKNLKKYMISLFSQVIFKPNHFRAIYLLELFQ